MDPTDQPEAVEGAQAPESPPDPPEVEAPEAPEVGTSETDKPEYFSDKFDPSSLDESLRAVYDDMHGAYTKKTMEVAEARKQHEAEAAFLDSLRSDPEVQAEVLQWLAEQQGYELEEGEDDDYSEPDPLGELSTKVETIEQRFERAQIQSSMDRQFEEIESEAGSALTDDQRRKVARYAALMDERNGEPDIRGAYAELTGFVDLDAKKKEWVQSKQTPQPPPGGKAGTKQLDLTDRNARRAHMAQLMAKEGAST